jgi:hypothetical protein
MLQKLHSLKQGLRCSVLFRLPENDDGYEDAQALKYLRAVAQMHQHARRC